MQIAIATADRASALAIGASLLAALAVLVAGPGLAADAGVASRLRDVLASVPASVEDEAGAVTIKVRCGSAPFAEAFCIESSMLIYMIVMQAIRDRKLDVSGKSLEFSTLMKRTTPPGRGEEFVLLAASWDGSELMRVDWQRQSPPDALELVKKVQVDRHWQVAKALGEVCTSLYGNPLRFCAMAKQSARR